MGTGRLELSVAEVGRGCTEGMVVVKSGTRMMISVYMRVLKSDEYEWLHRGPGKLTLFGTIASIFCDVKDKVQIMLLCNGNRKNVTSSFDTDSHVEYGNRGVSR